MNDDLIGRAARRGDGPPPVADLNAPLDELQADCMTARTLIRGWIANAREEVSRWQPSEYPG